MEKEERKHTTISPLDYKSRDWRPPVVLTPFKQFRDKYEKDKSYPIGLDDKEGVMSSLMI